jgi:hypothetical protein
MLSKRDEEMVPGRDNFGASLTFTGYKSVHSSCAEHAISTSDRIDSIKELVILLKNQTNQRL